MSGNQNEKEFFALVTTGRKGVEDMFGQLGGELARVAAPNVKKSFGVWQERALVEISNRDELKDVINSKAGIFSVYKSLAKAATLGIQIGGAIAPHAYLMPKGGAANLVVTAEGYAFAAVHGPGAVLMNVPQLMKVYVNDTFSIDSAAGKFVHNFSPFGDRGKLLGYFMKLEYKDGHVEIPHIMRTKVEEISDAYSTKEFSTGKKAPAWAKSPEEMFDKIATKQLLKKPVKESEGLAMLISCDEFDDYEPATSPDLRDVTERTASRLDDAAGAYAGEEPEHEPESLPTKPVSKETKPMSQGDIF